MLGCFPWCPSEGLGWTLTASPGQSSHAGFCSCITALGSFSGKWGSWLGFSSSTRGTLCGKCGRTLGGTSSLARRIRTLSDRRNTSRGLSPGTFLGRLGLRSVGNLGCSCSKTSQGPAKVLECSEQGLVRGLKNYWWCLSALKRSRTRAGSSRIPAFASPRPIDSQTHLPKFLFPPDLSCWPLLLSQE